MLQSSIYQHTILRQHTFVISNRAFFRENKIERVPPTDWVFHEQQLKTLISQKIISLSYYASSILDVV